MFQAELVGGHYGVHRMMIPIVCQTIFVPQQREHFEWKSGHDLLGGEIKVDRYELFCRIGDLHVYLCFDGHRIRSLMDFVHAGDNCVRYFILRQIMFTEKLMEQAFHERLSYSSEFEAHVDAIAMRNYRARMARKARKKKV